MPGILVATLQLVVGLLLLRVWKWGVALQESDVPATFSADERAQRLAGYRRGAKVCGVAGFMVIAATAFTLSQLLTR